MCVHEGAGLRLYYFRNLVLAKMKQIFPPKTDLRAKLVDGFAFLVFHASVMGHTDIGALPAADQTVALHIGMHYLSPYRPTFHRVVLQHECAPVVGKPPRVFFKAWGQLVKGSIL